jgi:hypothetical protein
MNHPDVKLKTDRRAYTRRSAQVKTPLLRFREYASAV